MMTPMNSEIRLGKGDTKDRIQNSEFRMTPSPPDREGERVYWPVLKENPGTLPQFSFRRCESGTDGKAGFSYSGNLFNWLSGNTEIPIFLGMTKCAWFFQSPNTYFCFLLTFIRKNPWPFDRSLSLKFIPMKSGKCRVRVFWISVHRFMFNCNCVFF